MSSIAIIGGDGAGKTSIARRLEPSLPLPARYLYMGVSIRSSNRLLPTSRLILLLKLRNYRKKAQVSGAVAPKSIPAHYLEYARTERGPWWTAARLLNRILEAWYRQILSLWHQLRGRAVIYDRHFLFDAAPPVVDSRPLEQTPLDTLNYWYFSHLYPKPDLTVFLDAPADVLYARKREATPERLNGRREAYLWEGRKTSNFVRVDATQPLDKVFDDVQHVVQDFIAKQRGGAS